MNQPKIEIVRLADLVFNENGPGIPTLATAIERHGIWGWDRFQRFVYLPPARADGARPHAPQLDCSVVLDLLAAESTRQLQTGLKVMQAALRGEPPPELIIEFNWDLQPYGWKLDALPDFAAIQAEQDPAAPARLPVPLALSGNPKGDATLMRLIGALLHYLAGADDHLGQRRAHPDWPSPGDPQAYKRLADYIDKTWSRDHSGLTSRTVTGKFKAALEILGNAPGKRPALAKTLRDNE